MKAIRMNLVAVLVAVSLAVPAMSAPGDMPNVESNEIEQGGPWERVSRMLGPCVASDDVTACVGVKVATVVDRLARMQKFEVLPGIQFKRDTVESIRDGKSLKSEEEILNSLPSGAEEKRARVFDLVKDSIANFASTRSLEVKLSPDELTGAVGTFNEARGKLKKLLGPIVLGVAIKLLAFLVIFGGGLALLVTKALVVSKIALIFASILGLQKLFNGSNGYSSLLPSKSSGGWTNSGSTGQWTTAGANQGWSNGASSATGYPYARSIQTESQEMAYGAQKP